jgi:hypothetical protein
MKCTTMGTRLVLAGFHFMLISVSLFQACWLQRLASTVGTKGAHPSMFVYKTSVLIVFGGI